MATTPLPIDKTLITVYGENMFYLLNGKPRPVNSNSGRGYSQQQWHGNQQMNIGSPSNANTFAGFFLLGGSKWELNGESCFNFDSYYNLLCHLKLSVIPGRTPDNVKMTVEIVKCQQNQSGDFSRVKNIVMKLNFYNEQDRILLSNCIQIDPKNLMGTFEGFMATETLLKLCQLKMKGMPLPPIAKNVKPDQTLIDCEFEFVKLTAELEVDYEATTQELSLAKCDLNRLKYLPSTPLYYHASTYDLKPEVPMLVNPPSSTTSSRKSKDKDERFSFKFPPAPKTEASEPSFKLLPENTLNPQIPGTKDQDEVAMKLPSLAKFTVTFPSVMAANEEETFSKMVSFKVGKAEQVFLAHKNTIMAKSPVFQRMLTVDMKEKQQDEIILKEVEPQVVQNFLSLLYCNRKSDFNTQKLALNLTAMDTLDLLEFAHMYELSQLLKDLTITLVSMPNDALGLKAVLAMFIAGCQFDIVDLKFRALQWIKANRSQIFNFDGQLDFKECMEGKEEYLRALIFELL